MSFSVRMGLKQPNEAIQLNSMDNALRMRLSNYLLDTMYKQWTDVDYEIGRMEDGCGKKAARLLWTNFLTRSVAGFDDDPHVIRRSLPHFANTAEWYSIYDLLEFVMRRTCLRLDANEVNTILQSEMSGYRIIDDMVVPISDTIELESIAEALESADSFSGAREHIVEALRKLSQKPEPDLRNAIKEAISAVESAARVVAGDPKATLGDALKVLKKRSIVHPTLIIVWDKLYGYTSDEQGIRHAMMDDPNIDFPTAKYMVMSCSAFVNLLRAK